MEYSREISTDCRFFGIFELLKPIYFVRDLDLIRQITIKDFDSFVNHKSVFEEEVDPIFMKNLFVLRDQKWKDMRSVLSPAFTGSKMRRMFSLITDLSTDYLSAMEKTIKTEQLMEFKEFTNKFCNDVIFKCAFGVSVNSYSEPDNEYFVWGRQTSAVTILLQLKFLAYGIAPKIMSVSCLKQMGGT